MTIDIRNNSVVIDDIELKFPISIAEVESVLGKADEAVKNGDKEMLYIFHSLGMVFTAKVNDPKWFKYWKLDVDEAHNIISIDMYYGEKVRPMFHETSLPESTCKAQVTQNGRSLWFISGRDDTEQLHIIYWSPHKCKVTGEVETLTEPLSISYQPKREHKPASYKLKKCKEEVLEFENFNFKLAVIQVLMYDLEVLEPYFDIYDFAMQYTGKEIDTESFKVSKPVLNFFKKLPVPKSLAEKVEEIHMDGGNKLYSNIFPMWDGEDDLFDLNAVTEEELKQFTNLKKATIMSGNFDEVAKVFHKLGIEVEEL